MFDSELIDFLFEPFDWDKKSYKFNREEKDMHPYSIIKNDKETIITHNVLGINKEDLKLTRKNENGDSYIVIEGKTKDELTNKEYSVSSRFALDESQLNLSGIKSSVKNGLLYIVIPNKKDEKLKKEEQIEIL